MSSAAYFDVDGTLLKTNLIQPTIHFFSNQSSVFSSFKRLGAAILDAPIMLRAELRDRRLFNERLYFHYKGMSEDRLEVLAKEIFDEIMLDALYPGAKDLIALCKKAGQRVVLITGSLDITIQYLAKHLGADDFITNRLEYKDGIATGRLRHPVVAGPVKSHLIVEDAKKNGHDLSQCHGYSDSYSDVPMLSVVGQAFCVNPDKKLTRLAQAYKWPIIDITRKTPGTSYE